MSNIINLAATVNGKDFNGAVDRDPMWCLSVFKGGLVEVRTTEGYSDDYKCEIHLHNWYTGKTYALNHAFIGKIEYREMIDEETGQDFSDYVYIRSETLAERLIEKMKAKNKINLTHWLDITNDPAYQ